MFREFLLAAKYFFFGKGDNWFGIDIKLDKAAKLVAHYDIGNLVFHEKLQSRF